MAGLISISSRSKINIGINEGKRIEKVVVSWVGDAANGSVPALSIPLNGWCIKVVTNPGSTAPIDNYDIALGDPDDSGLDALGGLLANRDTANSEQVYTTVSGSAVPILLAGTYSLTVSNNSVNSATGDIIFYLSDDI